jgi:hypothetical protein
MFDTRNLDSGGVGPRGGEHPTHAFFPLGPPPSRGCAYLLIWWLRGDLRDMVASTTLSYDGVTGWIIN